MTNQLLFSKDCLNKDVSETGFKLLENFKALKELSPSVKYLAEVAIPTAMAALFEIESVGLVYHSAKELLGSGNINDEQRDYLAAVSTYCHLHNDYQSRLKASSC